jgi:hypothetical protein
MVSRAVKYHVLCEPPVLTLGIVFQRESGRKTVNALADPHFVAGKIRFVAEPMSWREGIPAPFLPVRRPAPVFQIPVDYPARRANG